MFVHVLAVLSLLSLTFVLGSTLSTIRTTARTPPSTAHRLQQRTSPRNVLLLRMDTINILLVPYTHLPRHCCIPSVGIVFEQDMR